MVALKVTTAKIRSLYLNRPVQGGTSKLVVVLGIDDNLHDIVSVTLKHLAARPLLLPVPQFDQHVICAETEIHSCLWPSKHVHAFEDTSIKTHMSFVMNKLEESSMLPIKISLVY